MMPTANSTELLQSLKGRTVVGVIRGFKERTSSEFHADMLILDDGTGFCFNSNGAFWLQPPEDVQRGIDALKRDYENAVGTLNNLLELAGGQ